MSENLTKNTNSNIDTVSKKLSWFFGGLMLLFSYLLLSESSLASALGFFAALISIPPTGKIINQFLQSKYHFIIDAELKVCACVVFSTLFIFLMAATPEAQKPDKGTQTIPEQQPQKTTEQIESEKIGKEFDIELEKGLEKIKNDSLLIQKKIEKQFSPWDGRHIQLYNFLKENLRDPDSLEHIESSYERKRGAKGWEKGVIEVKVKYRAKNGFGGYNVESISADCDLDGNILKINEYAH